MGTRSADFSFVTGRGECVEKTIDWKIENFAEFLTISRNELQQNGVIFDAGYCILYNGSRATAKWKYYFDNTKVDEEDWIGGFLTLDMGAKSAVACYSVSLSSGGKPIISFTAERANTTYRRGDNKLIRKSELLQKIKSDVLDVAIVVKVFSDNSFQPVRKYPSSNSAEQLKGKMTSDLVKMLESEDGAEIEIKVPSEVGGEVDESSYTKKAHKNVLMTRSPVFAKMFAEDSTMIEAQTGKVIVKDLSPKGLDIFLHYLYTGEVLSSWVQVVPELVNAAEKYDCGELKQYCGLNIMDAVSTNNAAELYKLAKFHKLTEAMKSIGDFTSKNSMAVLDQVVEDNKIY